MCVQNKLTKLETEMLGRWNQRPYADKRSPYEKSTKRIAPRKASATFVNNRSATVLAQYKHIGGGGRTTYHHRSMMEPMHLKHQTSWPIRYK